MWYVQLKVVVCAAAIVGTAVVASRWRKMRYSTSSLRFRLPWPFSVTAIVILNNSIQLNLI